MTYKPRGPYKVRVPYTIVGIAFYKSHREGGIRLSFSKQLRSMLNLPINSAISYKYENNILKLKLIENPKRIKRTDLISRIDSNGTASIAASRIPELSNLVLPDSTVHISYIIVDDEMHIDLSQFVKKEESKMLSFATLTKREQREIVTKKVSSFADLKQHISH